MAAEEVCDWNGIDHTAVRFGENFLGMAIESGICGRVNRRTQGPAVSAK